jgi:beta-glucanase (GH16 family)
MKPGGALVAVAAATVTLNAAEVGPAGATRGGTGGTTSVQPRGGELVGAQPEDPLRAPLASDLSPSQSMVAAAPPPGIPAPSRRTFHPVRWEGRTAEFRLRAVRPSSVRRAYAVAGQHRETVRLAKVARAARRGILRVRFPARVFRRGEAGSRSGQLSHPPANAMLVLEVSPAWTLVFQEEFQDDALDPQVWHRCFWWAPTTCSIESNRELELYTPENVYVDNGVLRMRAERRDAVGWNGDTYHYTSGIVTTGGLFDHKPPGFTYTYGYAEARVRVPSGKGLWPAFWMSTARYRSRPEIDVMEILGDSPNVQNMNVHYRGRGGAKGDAGATWAGPDFSTDWHTFGVDWQPESIVWYVDGVERWRFSETAVIPREPMYLLLNLAVGGVWAGAPDASTGFPSYFDVDYVRVWQ